MKYNKLVRDKIPEIIKQNGKSQKFPLKKFLGHNKIVDFVCKKSSIFSHQELLCNSSVIPVTHIANDEEYLIKLKEKLKEEAGEYIKKGDEEELADILEIIYAICDFKKIDKEKLELLRKKKAKERGGFKDRIILDETK